MPEYLRLALECQPIPSAITRKYWTFARYPQHGGYYDQDAHDMELMRIAFVAYGVFTKQEWTQQDAEFIAWMSDNA